LTEGDFPFLVAELCAIVAAELAVVGLNGPNVVAQTVKYYSACMSLGGKKAMKDDGDDDDDDDNETATSFKQRVIAHISKFLFHMFHKGIPEYEEIAMKMLVECVSILPEDCLEKFQLQDIITLHAARNTLGSFTKSLTDIVTPSLKEKEMSKQDMDSLSSSLIYIARLECRFPSFLVQALHNEREELDSHPEDVALFWKALNMCFILIEISENKTTRNCDLPSIRDFLDELITYMANITTQDMSEQCEFAKILSDRCQSILKSQTATSSSSAPTTTTTSSEPAEPSQ